MMIQNIANQYLGSDLGLRIKIPKNENIEKLVFFPKNDKTFIKKILFIEIFFGLHKYLLRYMYNYKNLKSHLLFY